MIKFLQVVAQQEISNGVIKYLTFFLMDVLSQPLCNRLQRDWKLLVTSMTTGAVLWAYPTPKYQSQQKTPTAQTLNPLLVHL